MALIAKSELDQILKSAATNPKVISAEFERLIQKAAATRDKADHMDIWAKRIAKETGRVSG